MNNLGHEIFMRLWRQLLERQNEGVNQFPAGYLLFRGETPNILELG